MKCVLSLLLLVMTGSYALNILGIFPYQGKSHFYVFRTLLRELAEKGHNVNVVTFFPEKDPIYNEIILSSDIKVVEGSIKISTGYLDLFKTGLFLMQTGITNCEHLLKDDRVRKLSTQKFDVVLIEKFNSNCAHGLAYKIGAPVVGLTSHVAMPFHYGPLGIPFNPAYVPVHFLGGGSTPTLYQRIERTWCHAFINFMFSYTNFKNERTVAKYLGDDIPPLTNLAAQEKFLLLYQNFILTGTRAFPSNVIEVGGYHIEEPKELPKDLKKFLDTAKHGVIYISFGSVIKASTLAPEKKQAILDTILALPYKFIWKWDDEFLPVDKSKVYIGSWLPQFDILSHNHTLAFLSHGGMLGTTEALHSGVPIVAMPVFGDQPSNAAAIEESGAGVQVSVNSLTKEVLLKAFETVLSPEFRARAQLVSKAWRDRPLSPMDTAVYWIEYAAKYPELNLTSPSVYVPLYQEQNWDIVAVMSAFFGLIAVIIMQLVSLCNKKMTKGSDRRGRRKRKIY